MHYLVFLFAGGYTNQLASRAKQHKQDWTWLVLGRGTFLGGRGPWGGHVDGSVVGTLLGEI